MPDMDVIDRRMHLRGEVMAMEFVVGGLVFLVLFVGWAVQFYDW